METILSFHLPRCSERKNRKSRPDMSELCCIDLDAAQSRRLTEASQVNKAIRKFQQKPC